MRVLWMITVILAGQIRGLCLWSGLPQRLDLKLTTWLLLHRPTNWWGLAGRVKGAIKPAIDFAKRF